MSNAYGSGREQQQVVSIRNSNSPAKRRALIDEYGAVNQQWESTGKPLEERRKELRAKIAAWFDLEKADQAFVEDGNHYSLHVSERAHKRTITNMAKLFRKLGAKLFLKLCSFPLAAVDTNVPEVEHKLFLIKEQTGSRELKTVPHLVVVEQERKAA